MPSSAWSVLRPMWPEILGEKSKLNSRKKNTNFNLFLLWLVDDGADERVNLQVKWNIYTLHSADPIRWPAIRGKLRIFAAVVHIVFVLFSVRHSLLFTDIAIQLPAASYCIVCLDLDIFCNWPSAHGAREVCVWAARNYDGPEIQ